MATVTWNAPVASNWNDPSNWSPSIVPGPDDDVVFNNTSVKGCTVDANVHVNSIYIYSTYNSYINADGASFTVKGNFIDDGGYSGANRNYGTYIAMLDASSSLTISPGGTVTYSACDLIFDNVGQKLRSVSGATWGRVIVSNGCSVVLYSSPAPITLNVRSDDTPLILGSDATFNHSNSKANFIRTSSGDLVQMAPGSVITGAQQSIFFKMGNGSYTLPYFNYVGAYQGWAAMFMPYEINTVCSLTLTSDIYLTNRNIYIYTSTAGSVFYFDSNDYGITCEGFRHGCSSTTGVYSCNFRNSFISSTVYSDEKYSTTSGMTTVTTWLNKGTVSIAMDNVTWTLRCDDPAKGSWKHDAHNNVDVGTWYLNVVDGSADLHTSGVPCFYDVHSYPWGVTCHNHFYVNNFWGGAFQISVGTGSIATSGNVYAAANFEMLGSYLISFTIWRDIYMQGHGFNLILCKQSQGVPGLHIQGTTTVIFAADDHHNFKIFEVSDNCDASFECYDPLIEPSIDFSGTTPYVFILGENTNFVNNLPGGVWIGCCVTGYAYSLGLGYSWSGTGPNIINPGEYQEYGAPRGRHVNNLVVTIPDTEYTGSGYWKLTFPDENSNMRLNFGGFLNIGRNMLIVDLPRSDFSFYTMDYPMVCGEFRIGSSARRGSYWFGWSVCDITYFNAITSQYGYTYLENSQWFCGGNWTNGGINHVFNPGLSHVTITTTGTITPNIISTNVPKQFYDITADPGAEGTVTLAGSTVCATLHVISGNYTQAGCVVTAFNTLFDNYGTLNTGGIIRINRVWGIVRISSTVGTITSSQTYLQVWASGVYLQMDQPVLFQAISIWPECSATLYGLASGWVKLKNFASDSPLRVEDDSYFVVNLPLILEIRESLDAMVLGANAYISGTDTMGLSLITVYATYHSIIATIPTLTLRGTASLTLTNLIGFNSSKHTKLTGPLSLEDGELKILNQTWGPFQFETQNHPITSPTITYGSSDSSAVLVSKFGSSIINVGDVNPTIYNDGTNVIEFYKSHWYVGRNWTFPSDHTNRHAWDKVTFIGTNDGFITCNGREFNWLYIDSTSKTVTLADNLICREYRHDSGNFDLNGYSINAKGDAIIILTPI